MKTTQEVDRVISLINGRIKNIMLVEHIRANRLPNGRFRVKRKPITPPCEVRELQNLMQSAFKDQSSSNLLRVETEIKTGELQNTHISTL